MTKLTAINRGRAPMTPKPVPATNIEFIGKAHSPVATDVKPGIAPVTASQIEFLVKNSKQSMELLLGPDAVNYLLSINQRNRKLSDARAREFASVMDAGKWLRTGESIIVSDKGILNTGQHRLTAMKYYGKPVWAHVVFGMPHEAFVVTDTGRPHSATDVLNIRGVKNYALVAATLRLLVIYRQGLPASANYKVGPQAVDDALKAFPDIENTTTFFASFSFPSKGFRTAVLNALTWLSIHKYGEDRTREFLQTVSDGVTDQKSNPARQLRERFMKEEGSKATLEQHERFALAIKALVAFMNNKSVHTLVWRNSGPAAEPFPLIPGIKL